MDQEGQEQQPTSVSPEAGALKTSEKGTKKSSKALIPILAVIALAGVVFGIYGILQECPSCIVEDTPIVFEPSESNPTEQKSEESFLDISRLKTPLSDGYKYRVISSSAGVSFEKNDNGEWLIIPSSLDDTKGQILDFPSEPAQIFIGTFFAAGSEIPLFVLQDGTVGYINKSYDEKGERKFTIQKFEGLKNIIRLQQAYGENSNLPGGGEGYTVIAEDKDGYYYDLTNEFSDLIDNGLTIELY